MGTLRTIVENVVGKERPYGKVELFLGEYMDAHGFSRNGLAKRTGLDYKTVDRYYQSQNLRQSRRHEEALEGHNTDNTPKGVPKRSANCISFSGNL